MAKCAYCGGPASTKRHRDEPIPQTLFGGKKEGLPSITCCFSCNQKKSVFDGSLATALSKVSEELRCAPGGEEEQLKNARERDIVEGISPSAANSHTRRAEGNHWIKQIKQQIKQGMASSLPNGGGCVKLAGNTKLQEKFAQAEAAVMWIIRGLSFHHHREAIDMDRMSVSVWSLQVPLNKVSEGMSFYGVDGNGNLDVFQFYFKMLIETSPEYLITDNIKDGKAWYMTARTLPPEPHGEIWMIRLYGVYFIGVVVPSDVMEKHTQF